MCSEQRGTDGSTNLGVGAVDAVETDGVGPYRGHRGPGLLLVVLRLGGGRADGHVRFVALKQGLGLLNSARAVPEITILHLTPSHVSPGPVQNGKKIFKTEFPI